MPLSTAGGAFYSETGNASGAAFTLSAIDQIRFWDNSVSGQVKLRVDKIEVIRE